MAIQSKKAKSTYFFPSHMFTFHSLVQLLLPMVKLNGVSQLISIEYKSGAWFNSSCVCNLKFRKFSNLGLVQFLLMIYNMSQTLHCVRKLDYFCNCKSEISDVCNAVEGPLSSVIKIVRHHAHSRFDWLISGHQNVKLSREAISVLSGKYKKIYVCPSCELLTITSGSYDQTFVDQTKEIEGDC